MSFVEKNRKTVGIAIFIILTILMLVVMHPLLLKG